MALGCLLLALLLLWPQGARAFDEGVLFSEGAVRTGSRLPVQLTRAPFAVTVISGEELRASGFHQIYDILRFQPGVTFFRASAAEASLGMRGTSDFLSNNILVLLDGRPVYDELLGNNFWSLLPVSVDDVDRIEIIRGPESVIYGANAFSGVINIITRKTLPEGSPSLSAHTGTPYRHLYSVRAAAEGLYLSATWDEGGSFEEHQHRSRRTRKLFLHHTGELFGRDALEVSFGLAEGDYDFKPFGFVFPSNRDGYQGLASLSYERGRHRVQLSWQKVEGRCPTGSSHHLDLLREQVSTRLVDDPRHRLLFGLGADYYRLRSRFMGGTHEQLLYHGFLEDHFEVRGDLVLVSALRFDHHPVTGDHFTPKLSLVHSLAPGHSLRASWGRAFKNPSLFQVYKDFCVGPVCHRGSTHVDAEEVDVFEVAYQGYPNPGLFLSLTGFYNLYHDILVSRAFDSPEGRVVRSYNHGRMHQFGFEAETSLDLAPGLVLKANYTYLHLDKDEHLVWGPLSAHQVNLGLVLERHRFFGALWWHWQSEGHYSLPSYREPTSAVEAIPAYGHATLNLGYRARDFRLSLLVENLFHDRHRECFDCEEVGTYFVLNLTVNLR